MITVIYGSYLGFSGYSNHTRNFSLALNRYTPVRIKNFSHSNNLDYLSEEQKNMIIYQNWSHEPWEVGTPFNPAKDEKILNIILAETNSRLYYNQYNGPKIGFCVWESSRQPESFFEKLKELDLLFVPSSWQRDCTIEQGYDPKKIFVVPEGVDLKRFYPIKHERNKKFQFMIFGRWEHRKYTREMVQAFIEEFNNKESVELLLSADNSFPVDEYKSTEERLVKYNLQDSRIKILHFPSDEEYTKYLQTGDCLLMVSRSEGWGLPGIESLACGTPTLILDWSAPLEYGKFAYKVKVKELKKPEHVYGHSDALGFWAEPDYEDLKKQMRYIYENWDECKKYTLDNIDFVRSFTWDNAAVKALKAIESLNPVEEVKREKVIEVINYDKEIIVIDCYPNSEEKMAQLIKTIEYAKGFNRKTALVSHFPLPDKVQSLVDYYIFDADNTLPDYRLNVRYSFKNLKLSGWLDRPYHSLPIVRSIQNAIKIFSEYDWMHFIEYDINLDLEKHFSNVSVNRNNKVVGYSYENTGIYTSIISFKPSVMLEVLSPNLLIWEDYKKKEGRELIFENWLYKILLKAGKIDNLLNSSSIDMKPDSFKQMPLYNFVFSETDKNKNILFIAHQGISSSKFKLTCTSANSHLFGKSLIDCDDYSYVILDNVEDISISYDEAFFHNFKVSKERKGEFTFLDKTNIKCKDINKLQIKNFFVDGAFIEILGNSDISDRFTVTFTDRATNQIVHSTEIGVNNWTKTNRKYFTDWNVKIVNNNGIDIFNRDISYFNKRVYIALTSKAMGDNIAWMPMVEEFRQKHGAQIICSTFHNYFFKNSYPVITFIEPGAGVPDIYAQFNIGCFDNELDKNKFNWRITPLQKVAADILGLSWKNIPPNITYNVKERPIKEKYVAISEHSTIYCKYWLYPDGWQTIIKYFNNLGCQVAVISKEDTSLENIINLTGKPMEETINNIYHSEMFIGTSSGPSWLAWALRKPLVLISGFSAEWAEMNPSAQLVSRIINKEVCHGCFNDPSLTFDRGDWRWCPRGRDFECSKMITPEMVIQGINKFDWKNILDGSVL